MHDGDRRRGQRRGRVQRRDARVVPHRDRPEIDPAQRVPSSFRSSTGRLYPTATAPIVTGTCTTGPPAGSSLRCFWKASNTLLKSGASKVEPVPCSRMRPAPADVAPPDDPVEEDVLLPHATMHSSRPTVAQIVAIRMPGV